MQRLDRADDGARLLARVAGAAAEAHRTHEAAIARLTQTIEAGSTRRLDQAAAALARDEATLDAADPMVVLARGFALVTDPAGRPVTSVMAAAAAETLLIHLAGGTITVRPIQPQLRIARSVS